VTRENDIFHVGFVYLDHMICLLSLIKTSFETYSKDTVGFPKGQKYGEARTNIHNVCTTFFIIHICENKIETRQFNILCD
jgi:hypothetical protein